MTAIITLTSAGPDSGPFNLYSNVDSYVAPFASGISKGALLGGYTSTVVPDGTTTIKVSSAGVCINSLFITVIYPNTTSTTTTTTIPVTSTTTSTTTSSGTTTSTTTGATSTTTSTTTASVNFNANLSLQPSSDSACAGVLNATVYTQGGSLFYDPELTQPVYTGSDWILVGENAVRTSPLGEVFTSIPCNPT